MITITPLHNDYASSNKKGTFLGKYMLILDANKIEYSIKPYFNQIEFWNQIDNSSHFIARYRGSEKDLSLMQTILPELERQGVKCLPNFNTAYHCGDKSRLSSFYKANGIKHPGTHIFWELQHVEYAIDQGLVSFPTIAKLRRGAASTNVIKVGTKKQLLRLANVMFSKGIRPGMLEEAAFGNFQVGGLLSSFLVNPNKSNLKKLRHKLHYIRVNDYREIESSCLIVQDFCPNNDFDTRVTVIGNRAFAFRRFNRPNDFRASGSGLIDYNIQEIDMQMVEMAFEISEKFQFQTMAYDFIYDANGKPSVLEHNFTYVDKAVAACPIYWDKELNTHSNDNRFPQYWQLVDFLEDKNLRY